MLVLFSSCTSTQPTVPAIDTGTEFTERTAADLNTSKTPGHLCIYYGYPSLINNSKGDLNIASTEFSKFNLIVFGEGLQQTSHPDHANTRTIVGNLTAKKRLTFGYVDLGVSTNNYSETLLRQQIDDWKNVGISGIMFDDAGYDYKVTRERQNRVVQYCRQLNLRVMMNAWNPDDVLAEPNCILNDQDYYLAESYLVGHDKYIDLTAWKKKADICYSYMKEKGIKIVCVATGGETVAADFGTSDKFAIAWVGAAMMNAHYFQMTNSLYSANNNIVHFFPNFNENYGTIFKSGIQKESDTHYYRSTDSHVLHIFGNGSSQSVGTIKKL
ncbi:MAG: hypothetical protein U0X91_27860 [Spirosomataceae bacterium]